MQRSFEKMVFHLLKITKRVGGKSNNIVLAGGAAMNCVFNGVLENSNLYKNKFIHGQSLQQTCQDSQMLMVDGV